jgi:DNA topoisomerase I
MSLIVVESPTKARTFNRILKIKNMSDQYQVFATVGHFRDLPAKEIAINYTNHFQPQYEIMEKKQKVVDQLRELAKEHKQIILATDPDREGESISYHVAYILGFIKERWPDFELQHTDAIQRIVFHEITPKALEEALAHPEELRINLVKAQQARRILDRIVGYELSPLLWKKTGMNWLSAGRVQTVALRLIVEREKEIQNFKIENYYQLYGNFKDGQEFRAKLVSKDGQVYEQKYKMQLFAGEYEYTKTSIVADNVAAVQQDVEQDEYNISEIKEEVIERFPPPPYTTSLLQQDSFQKLSYPSKLTMRLAQGLYERGLISYHRTDSFNLSSQFVFKAKDYITATYGAEYALEKPRGYRTKSRLAQEAHEAIRPTKLERTPKEVSEEGKLSKEQLKLYELIFNRALATQMKAAQVKQVKVIVLGKKGYQFESDFSQVLFDGYMKVLMPEYSAKHQDKPTLTQGEKVVLQNLESQEAKTKPPYRYNDASLIKTLEDKGIGRPSTYSAIISLIQDKHYIARESRYFIPTELGKGISDYLSRAFPQLFDLTFTATMEEDLDKIAEGQENLVELLENFNKPFSEELIVKKGDTEKLVIDETIDELCPNCGSKLTTKYSKFGKFFPCSNYPTCKYIKPNLKYLPNHFCPKDNGRLVIRYTKARKRFYGCENYPKCDYVQWAMNVQGKIEDTSEKKKIVKKATSKKGTKRKTSTKKSTGKTAKKTAKN